MQKATNKEKNLFGVLRTAIQEALNWIETQRCCEQNKRWGVGKAVEEDSSEKLHRLLFTDLWYTPVGIQQVCQWLLLSCGLWGIKKKKTKNKFQVVPGCLGQAYTASWMNMRKFPDFRPNSILASLTWVSLFCDSWSTASESMVWSYLLNIQVYSCTLSCVWLFATPRTVRLLCPWDYPGKNNELACHLLLQGIFPTQGLNPHLLCLQITGTWKVKNS